MSTDIISALRLDNIFTESRIVLVREISGCDGFFILSSIMGHQIKKKRGIILIAFHNSYDHYENVGMKMGFNLQRYRQSGMMEVYQPATLILNKILEEGSPCKLEELFSEIENRLSNISQNCNEVCFIIDGLSHLFDIGYNLKEINCFTREIIKTSRLHNGTLLVLHCNVASEDDDTHILSNLLSHMSYTVVDVENLSTGRSADVSGHITIMHPFDKFMDEKYTLDLKQSRYHFKLFERGAKLFAPGALNVT